MGQFLADGGDTWNWVNTLVAIVLAVGGAILGYVMKVSADDRKAIWEAIGELRTQNSECYRERGEHEARLQAQEGFSPSRPRPPSRHRERDE